MAFVIATATTAIADDQTRLHLRGDGECHPDRHYYLSAEAGTDEDHCFHTRAESGDWRENTVGQGDGHDVQFRGGLPDDTTLPATLTGRLGTYHQSNVAALIAPSGGQVTYTAQFIAHTHDGAKGLGSIHEEGDLRVHDRGGYDMFDFSLDVPQELVGEEVVSLEIIVNVFGAYFNDGAIALNGRSYIDLT